MCGIPADNYEALGEDPGLIPRSSPPASAGTAPDGALTWDLPGGVTAADVIEQRARLASGLRRPLGCGVARTGDAEHHGHLELSSADQDIA